LPQNLTKVLRTVPPIFCEAFAQMDAAEYKHLVLGLIFLKYVSDAFDERRREVAKLLADPASELFFSDDAAEQAKALEDRDYYSSANVFWVPQVARWETLRNQAKQPEIGRLLDDALVAIEDVNPSLKNILDKRFARTQIEPSRLGQLIDLISRSASPPRTRQRTCWAKSTSIFWASLPRLRAKRADSSTRRDRWCGYWWPCFRRTRGASTIPAARNVFGCPSPLSWILMGVQYARRT
jgi:type I restriction-modification system DNA methylase subunit